MFVTVNGQFRYRLTYHFYAPKACLMLKYLNARVALPRLLLLVSGLSLILGNAGCSLFGTHKRVQVPQLLVPLTAARKDRLFQEVNRLASLRALHGKVDIQFEDTSFATVGIAEKYRQVEGTITLQRPGNIYLIIRFSIVDIAQMASDGQHFAVAVLQGDEKYKRFVKGTNSAVYQKLESESVPNAKNEKEKSEKETVSTLSNLRPQHFTDALLIRPIDPNGGLFYSQSEFFQEESDTRPQAKKGMRVMRGYFLVEEYSQTKAGEAQLVRRFWFDRVNGIRLARLQTFDEQGVLITDVAYFNEQPVGSSNPITLPTRIEITRPQDQYKLSITYQDPAAVALNKEYGPKVFVLENKWGLPEIDLDAQNRVPANH
jgi:hypothetical protein